MLSGAAGQGPRTHRGTSRTMLVKSGPLRYWWAFAIRLISGDSHSDLKIHRFGVDALWSGRDLYGALPRADAGIPLPAVVWIRNGRCVSGWPSWRKRKE
ncbi:hypothetical protein A4R43_19255 [Amycolatopsis albispora]|uniref:Uncharacterized protein n=1 Tax=Amycolatopsis albispora TaxID=1804986 RepID=A0A344L8L9_9PSEU|nr:hypothetical protein A4R43_19255 [Amycolatopsis albispora]